MKKYSLVALMAVLAMAGCQDQNTETQPAPAEQAEPTEPTEQAEPAEPAEPTGQAEPTEQTEMAEQSPEADTAHSARSSLDWNGIYKGMVPCEDCAGTNLLVELKQEGQYSMSRSYVDKMSTAVMEEGEIAWNEAGNTIQIDEYHFFVAENQLFLVDQDDQRMMDEEGNPYTLSKEMMQ